MASGLGFPFNSASNKALFQNFHQPSATQLFPHFFPEASSSNPFSGIPSDQIHGFAGFMPYGGNLSMHGGDGGGSSSCNAILNFPPASLQSSGGSGCSSVGNEMSRRYQKKAADQREARKSRRSKAALEPRKTGRAYKQSSVIKGQWTPEEDQLLVQLVEEFGIRKWAQIAQKIRGRVGKQCRERWNNHLKPDIKKDPWSEEEDLVLIEFHKKIGNHWAELAKKLPGRTENTIKNHWNATLRKQNAKRPRKTNATQNGLLLQSYINAVTASPPATTSGDRKNKAPMTFAENVDINMIPDPYAGTYLESSDYNSGTTHDWAGSNHGAVYDDHHSGVFSGVDESGSFVSMLAPSCGSVVDDSLQDLAEISSFMLGGRGMLVAPAPADHTPEIGFMGMMEDQKPWQIHREMDLLEMMIAQRGINQLTI